MWGNVAVTQAYLTLSEVLGHLDLLAHEGPVREIEDGDVVRFDAVEKRTTGTPSPRPQRRHGRRPALVGAAVEIATCSVWVSSGGITCSP